MADLQSFKIEMHPDAEYSFAVDYSNDLNAGAEITSVVTTAIDLLDGTDVKATILDGAAQIQDGVDRNGNTVTNSRVAQQIKSGDGTLGKSYKITIVSTTNDANPNDFPAEIKLDIKHGVAEPV